MLWNVPKAGPIPKLLVKISVGVVVLMLGVLPPGWGSILPCRCRVQQIIWQIGAGSASKRPKLPAGTGGGAEKLPKLPKPPKPPKPPKLPKPQKPGS